MGIDGDTALDFPIIQQINAFAFQLKKTPAVVCGEFPGKQIAAGDFLRSGRKIERDHFAGLDIGFPNTGAAAAANAGKVAEKSRPEGERCRIGILRLQIHVDIVFPVSPFFHTHQSSC